MPRYTPEMQAKARAMHYMLVECMNQFAYYARNHRAKDTPEAIEKARVNEELVSKIAQVLS